MRPDHLEAGRQFALNIVVVKQIGIDLAVIEESYRFSVWLVVRMRILFAIFRLIF